MSEDKEKKEEASESKATNNSGSKKFDKKETGGSSKESNNHSSKKMKMAKKEFTASQFASLVGLNSRTKYWMNMKYPRKEARPAEEWVKEMIKEGVLEKTPEILNQMVPVSK